MEAANTSNRNSAEKPRSEARETTSPDAEKQGGHNLHGAAEKGFIATD